MGADNDSGTAVWNYVTVNGYGPSPSPTPAPSHAPTFEFTCFSDTFNSFDSTIWAEQCTNCSYTDGSLEIWGGDQHMVTLEPCNHLNRLLGQYVRDEVCDDQYVYISPFNDKTVRNVANCCVYALT